jgi:hypothetical protein
MMIWLKVVRFIVKSAVNHKFIFDYGDLACTRRSLWPRLSLIENSLTSVTARGAILNSRPQQEERWLYNLISSPMSPTVRSAKPTSSIKLKEKAMRSL